MANSPFMLSTAVSIIYILIRFIEMRFITKETKPLKILIRDTFLLFHRLLKSENRKNQRTKELFSAIGRCTQHPNTRMKQDQNVQPSKEATNTTTNNGKNKGPNQTVGRTLHTTHGLLTSNNSLNSSKKSWTFSNQ